MSWFANSLSCDGRPIDFAESEKRRSIREKDYELLALAFEALDFCLLGLANLQLGRFAVPLSGAVHSHLGPVTFSTRRSYTSWPLSRGQ
jgi:hypothetical protein